MRNMPPMLYKMGYVVGDYWSEGSYKLSYWMEDYGCEFIKKYGVHGQMFDDVTQGL